MPELETDFKGLGPIRLLPLKMTPPDLNGWSDGAATGEEEFEPLARQGWLEFPWALVWKSLELQLSTIAPEDQEKEGQQKADQEVSTGEREASDPDALAEEHALVTEAEAVPGEDESPLVETVETVEAVHAGSEIQPRMADFVKFPIKGSDPELVHKSQFAVLGRGDVKFPRVTELPLRPRMTFAPHPALGKSKRASKTPLSSGPVLVTKPATTGRLSKPAPPQRPDPAIEVTPPPAEARVESGSETQKAPAAKKAVESAPRVETLPVPERPATRRAPETSDALADALPSLGRSIKPEGLLDRIPILVKLGLPAVALIGGLIYFAVSGRVSSTLQAARPEPQAITMSEASWTTDSASDYSGMRRGRLITAYRPSLKLSDYKFEFTGVIEKKALGWVFRASDTSNYYGMKLEAADSGQLTLSRFAVVDGRESSLSEKPLPMKAGPGGTIRVRLEAKGPRFSVYVQGDPAEEWSDNRLTRGAVGFMNDREERGRSTSVHFSYPAVPVN
jgi:hypothetical protein